MSQGEETTLKKPGIEDVSEMLSVIIPILKRLQETDIKIHEANILAQWLLQFAGYLPTLGGVVSEAHAAWRTAKADAKVVKSEQHVKAREAGAKTATGAEKIAEGSEAYMEKLRYEIAADADNKRMINYREDVRETMQAIKKVIDLRIAEMKSGT